MRIRKKKIFPKNVPVHEVLRYNKSDNYDVYIEKKIIKTRHIFEKVVSAMVFLSIPFKPQQERISVQNIALR